MPPPCPPELQKRLPWIGLRCPETIFISHENATFLFSVFGVVQEEAKTPKLMGCCKAKFAFSHALKIGTFRGKWTLEWVIKTSHFVLLALYFLITKNLAFSLIASERCVARTAKNVWDRVQNSAKKKTFASTIWNLFSLNFSLSLFLSQ